MAQLTNSFEGGSNGSNILTTDTGSGNAWNDVGTGTGRPVYSNTHASSGSLAGKCVNSAGNNGYMGWTTAFGSQTDHYGRVYVWVDAAPTTNHLSVVWVGTGGTTEARVLLDTFGKMAVVDNSSTLTEGSVAYSTGQWIRIEFHITQASSNATVEAKLFNTASSTAASDIVTLSTGNTGAAAHNQIYFGNGAGVAVGGDCWVDEIVAAATSYPGPSSGGGVSTVIPQVAMAPLVTV